MPRIKNAPAGGREDGKAKGFGLFGGGEAARLAALRYVVGAALLSGVALSWNLWLPLSRSFPRAPLLNALPREAVPPAEYFLSCTLVAALVASLFARRPAKYLVAAITSLGILVLSDQTRLQPWVYQCLILLIITALHARQGADERSTGIGLCALRLVVASLYVWGGAQKLNYSFGQEVLPQLLAPAQNYLTLTGAQLSGLGVAVAAAEMFIGGGLLLKKTRKLCVGFALAMHGIILGLLTAQGRNSVVWAWNVSLALTVVVLFRRGDAPSGRASAECWRAGNTSARASLVLAVLYAVLPVMSFRGWWDMYLSGALYSGNTAVAVVRVGEREYEKLPAAARRQVFMTAGGERMLPLFEWSMAELNVPPYPEARVFRQVAREVCRLTGDDSQAELIMRGRPALLDGSYVVSRADCVKLGE